MNLRGYVLGKFNFKGMIYAQVTKSLLTLDQILHYNCPLSTNPFNDWCLWMFNYCQYLLLRSLAAYAIVGLKGDNWIIDTWNCIWSKNGDKILRQIQHVDKFWYLLVSACTKYMIMWLINPLLFNPSIVMSSSGECIVHCHFSAFYQYKVHLLQNRKWWKLITTW